MTNSTLATITYAGIGSRQTPMLIIDLMRAVAQHLSAWGAVLRSGAAIGADQAFEHGCDVGYLQHSTRNELRMFSGLVANASY